MNIETVYKKIRYRLSNDNLKVGDEVFPCASGRTLDNGEFLLHYLEFDEMHYTQFDTDFPNQPHIIEKIEKDKIITDNGYSHPQVYYKIIKKEKQIETTTGLFRTFKWIEI